MFILLCIRNNFKSETQMMPLYLSGWSTMEKGKRKTLNKWQMAKKKNHFPYPIPDPLTLAVGC